MFFKLSITFISNLVVTFTWHKKGGPLGRPRVGRYARSF